VFSNKEDEEVPLPVKTMATIGEAEKRKPFTDLYTVIISGKRYSGKQSVAEILRKHFSGMGHHSRVFYRANVLGGPPVAGSYKPKEEILKIYRDGMKESSLFYAGKTLDMLYDRNSPKDRLVLIISDIRNKDEIEFWREKSKVIRTVNIEAPDKDRRERGWDGNEDEYNFKGHTWDFILENGKGNDVVKSTNKLFVDSLLPCVEERAELSIITESTVYSKFLQDYAYILATVVQIEFVKVSSVNVSNLDAAGIAIAAPLACILQVPLTFGEPSYSDIYVTTKEVKSEYNGPQIKIDPSVYSYKIY